MSRRVREPARIAPKDPGPLAALGGGPDPIRAAAIAVRILKAAKLTDWAALADHPEVRARVDLTDEQLECLEQAAPVLEWVRLSPRRLPYRCLQCGSIGFYGISNPPSRCALTLDCGSRDLVRTPLVDRRTA